MANTYTKIYLHIVFAVKSRESFIPITIQQRIHLYMAGQLKNMGQYPVAIGGVDDHVHLLIDHRPNISVADIVKQLKTSTAKLINDNHLLLFNFVWQRGYSCFSYSASQVADVKRYILQQHEHHKGMSFREELIKTYERFGIEYDPRYIFEQN